MKLVKIKKDGSIGVLLIEEKRLRDGSYRLNSVMTKEGRTLLLFSDDFEVIGEETNE